MLLTHNHHPRMRNVSCLHPSAISAPLIVLVVFLLAGVAAAQPLADSIPQSALYVVNADGTGLKQLLAAPHVALWGPAWSPDGQHLVVAFTTLGGDQGELYIVDADGQHPKQLTHNGRNNYYAEWSHDGKTIAFVSQDGKHTETAEIETITLDGSVERRLTNNHAWEYGATWSRDDHEIAFGSQQDGTWQIWLMDADGGHQHPLPVRASGNAPKWSPDGRVLAFKSDQEGSDNIYVMDPDGTHQRNVTHSKALNNNPSWSPDGQRITFWSDRDGPPNIFVMDRDGSNVMNLTKNRGLTAMLPAWSPDGTRIVFHASATAPGVMGLLRGSATSMIAAVLAVLVAGGGVVLLRRLRQNSV